METNWGLIGTIGGLALAIGGHAVAMFFKTPKESATEAHAALLALRLELDRRITDTETRLTTLSLRYEGSHGKHDQALQTLADAVNRLTTRFDAWMGGRGAGGRQD